MLHPLDTSKMKSTLWCVPSAVSMLTGYPVEKAHSRAAFLQNKSFGSVKGMYISECIIMLHELGYYVKEINLTKRYGHKLKCGPSIKRFLTELRPHEFSQPMIIFTNTHAITSHMGWVGDNWTKHPVPLKEFPQTKRLVANAFTVWGSNDL